METKGGRKVSHSSIWNPIRVGWEAGSSVSVMLISDIQRKQWAVKQFVEDLFRPEKKAVYNSSCDVTYATVIKNDIKY